MERITKFFKGEFQSGVLLDTYLPFVHTSSAMKTSLKIWPPTYEPSWRYYQIHQANYWSASEHDPMDDVSGFVELEEGWKNALLQSFAVLAIGDDVVMQYIDENDLNWAESTTWLFKDQGARETVHKIVYNQMLQLALHSSIFTVNILTSDEFVRFIIGKDRNDLFNTCDLSEAMKKACFLIKMIFCERYLFAAPFLIINLMGESGYLNTCVKINMQVMKDEHVHYLHAVQLLHDLKSSNPTEKKNIDDMFEKIGHEFVEIVEPMVLKLGRWLHQKYTQGILDHTRFTLRSIYSDNKMQHPEFVDSYTSTPFSVFDKNTGVDKFNLMESNSTVYKAMRGTFVPDWHNLKPEIIEVEADLPICMLKRASNDVDNQQIKFKKS